MDKSVEDLVSVFFVGPGKCGTTWVYDVCRAHPTLNVGLIKEPGEFLKHDVDLNAYHKLWRGPGVRCDFSNTYFFSDAAAQAVWSYNPAARICITVRNPLSRLVSHYMFMRRAGWLSEPIDEAIAARPELVDRCRYHKHAQKWLERFGAKQMMVLRLETLQSDPIRYQTELFDYLGVPNCIEAPLAMHSRQTAALPRSRLLARGTKELAELARKARLFRLIEWVKRSSLVDILYQPLPQSYQQAHLQAIPDAVQKELEEEYAMFLSAISRHGNVRLV